MALVLVLAVSAFGATPPEALPSPLTGPGSPTPPRSDERCIAKAWRQLESGRPDRAARRADRCGASVAAQLLRFQVQLASTGDPTAGLEELVTAAPGYASAWFTLSVAAERAGELGAAYQAAGTAAGLWPDSPWSSRAARLRQQLVEAPLQQARQALAAREAARALEELEPALTLEPADHDLLRTRAEALVDLGRLREADEVLASLPDDPAALMLAGEVAEKQGRWLAAMERYEHVPEGTDGRKEALERVQLRWRLSSLPRYAQAALAATALDRAQLATLLVNLAPVVETIPGGRVPLLSDIVDTPCQREILASVRLGLIDVDELEHRFDPRRPVRPEELRVAADRLASLLGVDPPHWCDPEVVVSSPCTAVASPVTGAVASDVILALVRGEGP